MLGSQPFKSRHGGQKIAIMSDKAQTTRKNHGDLHHG